MARPVSWWKCLRPQQRKRLKKYDDDVNVGELSAHVRRVLAKDKLSPVLPDEVEPLVAAELRYEQSLLDL